MHASKLFTLLRGLRQEEIHWFQKFLKSPFHNNNALTIRLFEFIKKHLPELDSPKLEKEKVFKRLFPNEKFNAQKLRKVMFELAVLTEEFFVTMHLRNKKFQKKKILVKELGERNLYPQFEKGTKQLISELEKLPYRDTFFYQNIFELNYNYSNHQETNRQKLNGHLLKNATEHLDYFYLLQKQQLEFGINLHKKVFKETVILQSLKSSKKELEQEPTFQLYELINRAVSKLDNENNYKKIHSVFKREIEALGRKDKIITLKILLNYSSSQINNGNKKHFSKMLSLYKFGLEKELLLENGKVTETTFVNIITVGSNIKEFEWVENFIKKYKHFLPKSVQEDGTHFGLGLMYYHKKEYSKAINILLNHNFSKPLQIIHSKTILLRAYFELYLVDNSFFDLLIAQSLSFEKFIRRNDTISTIRKESYLNFTLYIRKITNAHWQNNLNKKLFEKINNTESVMLRFWLLEMLKNLLNKK